MNAHPSKRLHRFVSFAAVVAAIASTATPAEAVVVAWGDSLTAGAGGVPWTTQFQNLSGVETLNRGVGSDTSTQVRERMLAAPEHYASFAVIWVGRNNYTDPSTVVADVAAMVGALTTPQYLVLAVTNGDYGGWESRGGEGWQYITQIDSALAANYGSRYLDVRSLLVESYDPTSAQDLSDHARDIVPTSLRSDPVHLNSAGYGVVAGAVYERYQALVSAVPEPQTWALWLAGAAAAGYTARRRTAAAALRGKAPS